MADEDVTKHPLWKSALCWKCGQPMKLDDLQQKAERLGLKYPSDQPKYHVYCCYETNREDTEEFQTIVSLLRRYYGM